MNAQQRMGVLREVALWADLFYDKALDLGKKAATSLRRNRRSQITGIEAIANSAIKTTDIFDFIKLRVARNEDWRNENWGNQLLDFLSRDLRDRKNTICQNLNIDHQSIDGLEVHLLLIREFVRQLAAHYEYECAKNEMEAANG